MRVAIVVALVTLVGVTPVAAADDIGFFDPSTGEWHLPGAAPFYFGNPGDNPLMGDWDCDGVATPGLHRSADGYIYLRDSATQGIAERRFYFGNPGDVPIAGDWDGDGCDTVSLWRPQEALVYVTDRLGSADAGLGAADYHFAAGGPGLVPFPFDHDGDGDDQVAFHDPATGLVYAGGPPRYFGNPGDVVVAGRWDGEPTLGAYRSGDRLAFTPAACRAGARSWVPVVAPRDSTTGSMEMVVHPAERAALAPGVGLLVEWEGGAVVLDDCAPTVDLNASPGTALTITYRSPRGARTDVTWQQFATGPVVVVRQPWREAGNAPGDIMLAWQATGDSTRYLREIDRAPGLTVTSPIWWWLAPDGTVTGGGDANFVRAAHARGVEVWPAIASLEADRIAAAVVDPEGLAAEVSAAARAAGADGVNIDFEGFYTQDAGAVTAFAAELTRLVHAWGGATSFDIIPRSDQWDLTSIEFDALHWSQAPQRRPLAEAVDYLILMAYDEHNRHRPAGPVASPQWVEDVTRYLLRYTDAHRLILGIPFYGRLWGPDLYDRPRARGIGGLTAMEASGARSYDPRFGLDRVDFADGTYLWSETPEGLAHRVELKDKLGLAGLAAWRLGFDSPAVWAVIAP